MPVVLRKHGLPADYHDAANDEAPDYTRWSVTSDSSISSKHQDDGFCKNLRGCPSALTHNNRARVLMPEVYRRGRGYHTHHAEQRTMKDDARHLLVDDQSEFLDPA